MSGQVEMRKVSNIFSKKFVRNLILIVSVVIIFSVFIYQYDLFGDINGILQGLSDIVIPLTLLFTAYAWWIQGRDRKVQ
jgi:F0F1-type ATP synthase assembly protein I